MSADVLDTLRSAHLAAEATRDHVLLVEEADIWSSEWEENTREELDNEVRDRIIGRTFDIDKLKDLGQDLEDEGIHVNQGLLEWAAKDEISETIEDHLDELESLYDGFYDKVVKFATSAYEEINDPSYVGTMIGEVIHDIDRDFASYELTEIEGYDDLSEFFEEEEKLVQDIKSTEPPTKDEIRENYPEVPVKAYENFRQIFESKGPIEVTKQTEIAGYNG